MKTKLTKLICSLVAVAALAGCGGPTSSDGTEKATITIWTTDTSEMDIRAKQVEEFNAEHDDIEIVLEAKTSDGYSDLLKVACESKTAPDIYSYVPELARNGYAKPLEGELLERMEAAFLPGALRVPTIGGPGYGFALKEVSHKFVWNKDLFKEAGLDPEQPPKTWDEVIAYAKKITEIGDGIKYGFALPLKQDAFIQYYVINPSCVDGNFRHGGLDPVTGTYAFDSYKPMLEVMRTLKNDGSLFPTPGTLDNDTARAQFSAGNVGMMIAASWDVGVFNDQFPAQCEWGVTDFPSLDGTVEGGYVFGYGGNAFAMNKDSKYPEEQEYVYEWLMSEEVLKELSLAGKGPFTLKAIASAEFVPDDKKGAKEFATKTEPYIIADAIQEMPQIKLEGDTVYKVFADAIISDLDFDAAIADVNKRYNDAFDKFKAKEAEEGRDPERYHMPDYDWSLGK